MGIPPSYEESVPCHSLCGTADTTDDGRIDINFGTKFARTLALATRLPDQDDNTTSPPPYIPTDFKVRLSIVVQVVGSRGDVQPFLALGHELQRLGHNVRIATHDTFRNFVKQANLNFYPIGGDPAELMAYMVKNPGLIPEMKSLREGEIQKKRQMILEMLTGCWNSCIKPDPDTGSPFVANAIIANPPSFAHIHCAQAMGIPMHIMFTMPWSPTKAFPHPLARLRSSQVGEGVANYLSYGLVQILTWQGLADVLNTFRKSLDLEPVPFTEGAFLAETLKIPHTYCWSQSLVPKPNDWTDYIDVCGFFFRATPEYKPPAALHEFLVEGMPPVYIGFGSIVIDDPEEVTDIIIEAVRSCGARAIVSAGWSGLGRNRTQSCQNIFFLDEDCPHEWLFPRVAAVVHHGGAGTTACGLLNGRPTLVVPFFGDQYFWGDMISVTGAGPSPVPYHKLNSQNLSEAMAFCLTAEAASKAATISEGMKKEDGVSAAVASFHRHLPAEKLSCDIDSLSPAIWSYNKAGKITKLSGRVAEILIKHDKIRIKDLQPYSSKPTHIVNRRWEPTTAVASALTGTSFDILEAGNSLWKAPHDIRKQALRESASGNVSARHVGAMIGSSAMSIPRMYGAIAKGFLLDLPLAVTEGLRATPKLFGDEVQDHDPVVDWRSGGIVAGKTFAENLRECVIDLYTLPANGLEQDGIAGLSKGIGKSVLGMMTKSGAALTCLVAYPALGLSKSIHSTFHSSTRKMVMDARRVQSCVEIEVKPMGEVEEAALIERFEELSLSGV